MKAIIHRFGAWGDMVIFTPLIAHLKNEGYEVTVNTSKRGLEVLRHNPGIDHFIEHDTSIPPDERLAKHLAHLNRGFDKAINLCESIEGTLAKVPSRKDFHWSKEKRHEKCNRNFYDFTMEWAGYKDKKGRNGFLYFSTLEEKLARSFMKKYKGKFKVMWSLSGSSPHKAYPYTEFVVKSLLEKYGDEIVFFTVGDDMCELLEPRMKGVKNYSGKWPMRKSLVMTKYVDLVIGPDTGLMHGAGCFDTPKILFLSSNTKENLSKYWENCTELEAYVPCRPCHRLHYTTEHCILDPKLNTPVCMTRLSPEIVTEAIENKLTKWRKKWRPQHPLH